MIKRSPDLIDGMYEGQKSHQVRIVPKLRSGLIELTPEESRVWELVDVPKTRDEITAILGKDDGNTGIVDRLIEQGLLIDEEQTATAIPERKDLVEIGTDDTFRGRALYLFLADRCNLNCVYCYVPEEMRLKGKGIMPAEMMRKTIDEFLHHAKERGVKDTEIRFLGGEPLFDRELLLETLKHADATALKEGLGVQYVINTNGIYCDEKTVEALRPFAPKLFMIVSIDGDAETHNRHRPTPHGKPTYDKVMEAILRLKANDFYVCPHAVVSSENMNQIPMLMWKMNNEFGITQLSYSFVHLPPDHVDGIRDLTVEEKMAVIRATHAKADELGMEITGHWKFSIAQKVTNSSALCEGGTSTICVTSSGDMFACQRHVGDPSKRLGNVKDGLVRDLARLHNARLSAWLNTMTTSNSGGCSHCSLAGECGSKSDTNGRAKIQVPTGVDMLEFQVYQGGNSTESLDEDGRFYEKLLRFYLSNRPIATIRTTDFDKIINGMQPR
jgi:radical SAM protein with 4Fe4S-binding SPASM domain